MKRAAIVLLSLLCLASACDTAEPPEETPTPNDCDGKFTPPELQYVEIEDGQPTDFAVDVVIQAVDDDGIRNVLLYYRTEGVQDFAFIFMTEIPDQENLFAGQIPAGVVREPGVDWYAVATDEAECEGVGQLPEEAPKSWLNFKTEISVFPIPVSEDFDSTNCAQDIDDLGWTSYIGSFPQERHAWKTDPRGPLSGNCSAYQDEGIPGGVWECPADGGGIERDNWLITPALDFTTKESIAVRWFERHRESGICDELHEVYVSTGSPNPESEDWVLLATDLPFPGTAWQSSAWYDLTPYAGQERVYVALRYLAGSAGRWQIDDFYVGEPLADLVLSEAPALDVSVEPGSAGIELALTILNASDLYAAPALTVTLTTGDPDLAITTSETTLPALGVGESAPLDASFFFDVLATHADNAYLDLGLVLNDDAGHTWSIPIRMLMGEESYVTIRATTPTLSEVDLEIGYGGISSPAFSVQTNSELQPEDVGTETRTWRLDITEHANVLPPGPGAARWYLEWDNATVWAGPVVESMVFEVGGVEYSPTDLPVTLDAAESGHLLFPPPPELVVESFETVPDPAVPGGSVALQNIVLRNVGAATSGPMQCIAGSGDPHAVNFSTTPSDFGGAIIDAGGSATSETELSFEVAPQHTDNTDIEVTLVCSDGADTLTPNLFVPVPSPNITVGSVRIDDGTGNNDDFADPDETVDIWVTITNDGALSTTGPVTGTLTPALGDSSAVFVAPGSTALTFGPSLFAPGESAEAEQSFALSVDVSALMGDTMVFDAVFESDGDQWTEQLVIEVTGIPWAPCSEPDDPMGDSVGGFEFDIKGCATRSDDTLLQIRLDSWTEFNPGSTAVWFFLYEVPIQYSIEYVPPGLDFEEGCIGGEDVAAPVMNPTVVSDGFSATVRLHLDDLGTNGEIGRNVQVGFGVGYCSEIQYCDTYPSNAVSFGGGVPTCNESFYIPVSW